MLADIEGRELDAVVVWHLDRLHRQPRELEVLDVCDASGDVALESVTGLVDLASHDGRFTARILGAVAKKESDDKSRRIRRKHEEIALAGGVSGGGSRPFGYEADKRTIRPDEAAIIRECVRRLLAGEAVRAIGRDLTARGVETATGGAWSPQSLRRMLMSPRISGQRAHKGEIVAKAQWPAIVTPAETERIRALLTDPARRTNKSARSYLLVRLLRCGLCGATLVSRPRQDGTRRYVCASGPGSSGCGKITITAHTLEAFIVEAVLYRLDSPELAAALNGRQDDPSGEQWQGAVARAQAQLEELARAYADQQITLPEWLAARTPIEQRHQAARKRLANLNRTSALEGYLGADSGIRERWQTLDLTRQHAIITAVLDHLIVNPATHGNRFDPDRLTPVWRA